MPERQVSRAGRKQSRLAVLTGLAVLVAQGQAAAQGLPSEARARIDAVFAEFESTSPGCVVGVVKAGRLDYARGYGLGQLDHSIPLNRSSVFYLASVSKQFTAAAILIAEQGLLALDDDIRRHLPEFPNYGNEITVRDLLHHTSGIRDYLTLLSLSGTPLENVLSNSSVLSLIARQEELNFEPRSEFLYSNSGYVLLAEIIKRSTGRSLREYADQNIFEPLGMTSTHFHDDRRHVVPDRVFSYDASPDGSWRTNYLMNFEGVGDGGLYSSVEDLARWDAAFYGDLLGIPQFAARMYTQGVLSTGEQIYYAGGLGVGERRGLTRITHAGGLMAFRTMIARYPDQRTSVITLCNVGTADQAALGAAVEDIVLEHDFLQPPMSVDPTPRLDDADQPDLSVPASVAETLVGTYSSPALEVALVVEVLDGDLRVRTPSGNSFPLEGRNDVLFTPQGLKLEFVRRQGVVTGFLLSAPRARNIRFELQRGGE